MHYHIRNWLEVASWLFLKDCLPCSELWGALSSALFHLQLLDLKHLSAGSTVMFPHKVREHPSAQTNQSVRQFCPHPVGDLLSPVWDLEFTTLGDKPLGCCILLASFPFLRDYCWGGGSNKVLWDIPVNPHSLFLHRNCSEFQWYHIIYCFILKNLKTVYLFFSMLFILKDPRNRMLNTKMFSLTNNEGNKK